MTTSSLRSHGLGWAILAFVCCSCMISVQGARLRHGPNVEAQAASRRARMYSRFRAQKPKHTVEEINQNLQSIKMSLLEAAAYDAKVSAAHIQRMEDAEAGHVHGKASRARPAPDPEDFCTRNTYRKTTLKVVRDAPFIGLFNDLRNNTIFEGSSITYAKGAYYAIFDSLRSVGKVDIHLQFRGEENRLIPEDAGEAESGFEGLQYMASTDTFLAVRESIDHETHGLIPNTEEIKFNKDETSWSLASVCPVKFFGLEDPNKGWEGIHYYEKDNERYLLGLCESNFCKTIHGGANPPGRQRGNGRLILTKYQKPSSENGNECSWETLKEISLPEEAYFLDYAGIAFYPDDLGKHVAVVSQEDAAVWVGEFDWDKMEFVRGGKVFNFPRNDECGKVYCNVEGLTWLDGQRLMFASDRAKANQPFECQRMDQSVHIMALPA